MSPQQRLAPTSKSVLCAAVCLTVLVAGKLVRADESDLISNSIGMKLRLIPAGTFMMGSPGEEPDRDEKEELHEVTLTKPFYLGVYEVTQLQYRQVTGNNRSAFRGDQRPVENVEWKKAIEFCEALSNLPEEKAAGRSYRLPTEAEWEYACRAGTETAYHVGDLLTSERANFNGQLSQRGRDERYLRRTANVGSFEPNAFGLYDMHGNVAEWTADWYDPEYYFDSPEEDPLGPPFGVLETGFFNNGNENFFVTVRGGCWVDDHRGCRSAYRFRAMPNTQYRIIGFRVVCDAATSE